MNRIDSGRLIRVLFQNWFTSVNTLASILSLVLFFTSHREIAFTIIISVAVALSITLHRYYREAKTVKQAFQKEQDRHALILAQFAYLREIVRKLRVDYSPDNLRALSTDEKLRDRTVADIFDSTLNSVANVFQRITDTECTASFMVERNDKPQLLKTMLWSNHALTVRRESAPQIPIGQGLAGKTFQDGVTRYSNDFEHDLDFLRDVDKSWKNHYKSGICVAVKSGEHVQGVLCLDAKRTNVFGQDLAAVAEMASEALGLALQVSKFFHDLQ